MRASQPWAAIMTSAQNCSDSSELKKNSNKIAFLFYLLFWVCVLFWITSSIRNSWRKYRTCINKSLLFWSHNYSKFALLAQNYFHFRFFGSFSPSLFRLFSFSSWAPCKFETAWPTGVRDPLTNLLFFSSGQFFLWKENLCFCKFQGKCVRVCEFVFALSIIFWCSTIVAWRSN